MSLNSLISYKNNLFQDKVMESIKTIYNSDKAFSYEQRQFLEDMLETVVQDIEGFFEIELLSIRDRALQEDFIKNISNTYFYLYTLSRLIDGMFTEHEKITSFENSKLNNLNRLSNSIKQKLASLNLISGEIKYIFAENFSNDSYISLKDNSLKTGGGLLTLPIESSKDISVRGLAVASGSSGSLGSSDPAFESEPDLTEVLKGKTLQWEELDGSSCLLILEINFSQEEIINQLMLRFKSVDKISSCAVTSIKCFSKGKSIELLEDIVEVSPQDVSIPFYPVKTSKIFVTLSQTSGYEFVLSSNKSIIRKVISIDQIKPKLVKYVNTGAVESIEIPIPTSPSAANVSLDIAPTNENLFTYNLLYSVDSGSTWLDSKTIGASANIKSLYWKMLLSRNDNAFSQNSSVHETSTDFEYATQLEFVSGYKSPSSFALKKKAVNNNITVIQPKVLRRSGKRNELKIGESNGGRLRIKLPMPLPPRIIEDCCLKVNGKEWTYVNTLVGQAATAKVWTVDKEDYQYIVFGDDTAGLIPDTNSIITFSLDLEELLFSETETGYKADFDYLFDPDKDNINITYVSETEIGGRLILDRGEKIHQLPQKNIVSDSITITEKDTSGATYSGPIAATEVSFSSGDFTLSSGEYTVDYQNGVLYLYEEIPNDDILTVSFEYYPTKVIAKDKFSVIIEDSVPKGIVVNRDSFPAKTTTDTVNDTLVKLTTRGIVSLSPRKVAETGHTSFNFSRKHPIRGTVNASDLFSSTDTIPSEEVTYIDGFSEFLGLIKVDSEKTSAIAGPGLVSFVIRGATNFYSPLGISFDDSSIFVTEVSDVPNSSGEWTVDTTTGEVSVYVDSSGLPSGINYTYYYRDNSFSSTNKYSINYKRGILHSITGFKSLGTVTYKTGNFFAGYDIATLITDFEFNKDSSILEVKTENNFDSSKLIKIIYPFKILENTLDDLKDYYSPLISTLIFRFN